ncbi:VOC family protein [Paenibacillus herberti]|uniref:Ring-cleaving dioxygenase n=1 Tax=Paenibacillus herberti TaxID=1619309 RepID=A0A229NY72_9BACL|nr:VOC family protein [Paenibacillus herberti]OXM14820.1 ring-cleaving dioxygenase [Paenibacillus herberti]
MRIQALKLLTSELEQLKRFYTEILELSLVEQSKTAFTVQVGQSQLTFEQAEATGENPFYHFAFNIPGNKMDESIAWLNSACIEIADLPNNSKTSFSQTWNSTSIYFYDSAHNIVEFIARHTLDHTSSAPFSSKDLLNISEIGLVVNDVPGTKDLLTSALSIDGYKNSYDTFGALGDEEGLFILAVCQRVWFGSDKKSDVFKTEIIIEGTQKGQLQIGEYPYQIIVR